MAAKVITTRICDLPHDSEQESSESVAVITGGDRYDIDLCFGHWQAFAVAAEPFISHAPPAAKPEPRQRRHRNPVSKAEREWLRNRPGGPYQVSDRSRLSRIDQAALAGYRLRQQVRAVAS